MKTIKFIKDLKFEVLLYKSLAINIAKIAF